MTKVLQFELWRECNCFCTFCTIKKYNRFTPDRLKEKVLDTTLNELKNIDSKIYETVGFIGGEFFQGQLSNELIKNKFFELMEYTNDMLTKGLINNVWINASLLIGDQKDLYNTIEIFKNNEDKLWILTSYDTLGRFHTKKMYETWDYHMLNLKNNFSKIKLNITSILTGDFITKYLNNEINLHELSDRYNSSLFFKNPVVPESHQNDYNGLALETKQNFNNEIGYFFPKRKDFLRFLDKFYNDMGENEFDKLMDMHFKADEVRKNYNNDTERNLKFIRNPNEDVEYYELNDDVPLDCGHNAICNSYCDSTACIMCDKYLYKSMRG